MVDMARGDHPMRTPVYGGLLIAAAMIGSTIVVANGQSWPAWTRVVVLGVGGRRHPGRGAAHPPGPRAAHPGDPPGRTRTAVVGEARAARTPPGPTRRDPTYVSPAGRTGRPRSGRRARRPAASPGSASAAPASSQAGTRASAPTGSCAARRTSSSRPRTCRSVPAKRCTLRGGPSWAGDPASRQAQPVAHRARPAARRPGHADQRPQFHDRDREADRPARRPPARARRCRPGRWRGRAPASARPCTSRATTRRTLVSTTGCGCPYPKQATARAVYVPMPGQRLSSSTSRRDDAAVPLGDGDRRLAQPQRPAGVAELAPGADHVGGARGGQRGRAWASGPATRARPAPPGRPASAAA